MADPVTAAIEEIMDENVLPLPPSTSYLPPALLSLLAQAEAQLASHLPSHAQEKLKEVDAWGLEALGLPHAGTTAVCLLLLLLLLSLLLLGSSGGAASQQRAGRQKSRGKPTHIVLVGPCGAGKTSLYHQLLFGAVPETVTSMEESEGVDKERGFTLVDFPGHERLRDEWFKRYLYTGKVAGVVFVVDAADFSAAAVRGAAEFLYNLLTHSAMEGGPPVLIACHKSDLPSAKGPSRVRTLLTQELDRLRKTRGGVMDEGEGEEGEDRLPLGRTGQPLNLDIDAPSELSFAATSVVQQQQQQLLGENGVFEEDRGVGPLIRFIVDKALA